MADGNVYIMGGRDDDGQGAVVKIHQIVTNAEDDQGAALALARHEHDERFDEENNALTIQSKITRKDTAESKPANVQVYYEVRIPRKFELDLTLEDGDAAVYDIKGGVEIVSQDGSIVAREIKGSLKTMTVDGDVVVESIKGKVKAESQDGDLVLSTIHGAIEAKTEDGDIVFSANQSVVGDIKLFTTDGDIVASLGSMVAVRLKASATDGEILAQLDGLEIDYKTQNKLTAQIGEDARFTIEVSTVDGDVVLGAHKAPAMKRR